MNEEAIKSTVKCKDAESFLNHINNFDFENAKKVLEDKFSLEELIETEIFLENSLEVVRVVTKDRKEKQDVSSGSG